MKRKITIVLVVVSLIIISIIFNITKSTDAIDSSDIVIEQQEAEDITNTKSNKSTNITKVKVDIKGAIVKPGVYEVNSDYRVIDVIKLAGGLKNNANTNYINLSSKVTDEMVIWIYTTKEISDFKLKQSSTQYMIKECNCPVVDNTTCLNSNKSSNDSKEQNGIININTATLDELTKLDGIGESKANSIIEYRTKNGPFKNIQDIMNVSGIGEAAYNKIKEHIEV